MAPEDGSPQPWTVTYFSPHGELVSTGFSFITPEMAQELLLHNEGNRALAPRVADQYTRSMADGDWEFTGDPAQTGPDRELYNGQHRLQAIARSGVGQWMLTVDGLPDRARKYCDIGRRRSAVDMLSMDGVETPRVLASTAHMMLSWAHWRTAHSAITPGVNEVVQFAVQNQARIRDAWKLGNQISDTVRGSVSVPALAAAYLRALEVAPAFEVAHFFDRVAHNNGLRKGEPAWSMHSRMVSLDGPPNKVVTLWLVIRGWNAEMQGEGLGKMIIPKVIRSTALPDLIAPVPEDVSPERETALAALENLADRQAQRAPGGRR